jgi:hypothetical protein
MIVHFRGLLLRQRIAPRSVWERLAILLSPLDHERDGRALVRTCYAIGWHFREGHLLVGGTMRESTVPGMGLGEGADRIRYDSRARANKNRWANLACGGNQL